MKKTLQRYWYRLFAHKAAFCGFITILIFFFLGIFAPLVAPHDPMEQSIDMRKLPPGTSGYILGSDELGRDVFSRILYGARLSMIIGIVSVGIACLIGMTLGLIAAYYGGALESIIMRITDIMLSFPYVLLTIVIVALLGPSLLNAIIAMSIAYIPGYARVARAAVLTEKNNDYVLAERAIGAGNIELMFSTILPNSLAPILVQATLGFGEAIIGSAALSFLGLGAQPPTPEWGLMIASSREFITSAWWIVTFPGLSILIAVLGFNLFGDGLRDILDVRLRD